MAMLNELTLIARDVASTVRHKELRGAIALYTSAALLIFGYSIVALSWIDILPALVIAVIFLPFVEFVTHKYVLHLLELAKNPVLAKFWERVHYAHHMEPKRLDVILAHPASAILLVATVTVLYAALSFTSAIPLAGAALLLFSWYEIVHFSCHTDDQLQSSYFLERRQAHALHHYVNENRNFGITTAIADRLFGTKVEDKKELVRSPTTRNLGYTGEFADRYPYLKGEDAKPRP